MSLLSLDALAKMRGDHRSHEHIVRAYRSGMTPTCQVLHEGYVHAVQMLDQLLDHVAELEAQDDVAPVAHAAIAAEITRRTWELDPTPATGDLYVKARAREIEAAGEYLLIAMSKGTL